MKHDKKYVGYRVRVGAIAAAGLLAGTLAASAVELTPQEKALIPAAKKEAVFADRTAVLLGEGFVKRYDLGPDFKFNNLRKGTGATVAQTRQEIQAGKFTTDILMVSAPGFFDIAAKHGDFLKLDNPDWADSAELAKEAGQYTDYPYVVMPLAYTFQPVWNTSCPGMKDIQSITSYADTVQPALKGKTIASDVTKSFTYTNTAISLQENKVLDLNTFWDKLKATDPIIEFRSEAKMQMVVSCQRPFDMWNIGGRVYQNVLKDPSLAKVLKMGHYKEGQVMLGNQAAVLKLAPHPAAAQLLLDFMLTDIMVEGEAVNSFRKDYNPPDVVKPYLLDMKGQKLLGLKDWVAAQAQFKTVRTDWEKKFK
jgi:ABC-type Fe3+ transport system substrate-binding protein